MSIRETLARNTKWNAAGRLWEAAVSLLLMRYIAGHFEDSFAALGLWFMLGAVTGYASLLDLGISSSFTKYVAEFAAKGEGRRLSAVVSTGLVFYIGFGALLVALAWPCAGMLAAVVRTRGWFPGVDPGDIRYLFRGCVILYAASGALASFSAVPSGMQRMDLSNVVSMVSSLVKIAATVWFLEGGFGARGLLYAALVSTLVFGFGSMAAAFWLAPELRVSPRHIDRATFRLMFGYGWRTQVARLANLVMLETDRVIIGAMAGLNLVPPYEFGLTIANKIRQVPGLLLSAVLPAASDLDAREEHERVQRLYLLSSKYVAAAAVPMLAFAVAAAGMIMRTWLGEKPAIDTAAWVLRILAVAYLANIMPGAGVAVVLGKGRADLQMIAGLICTVANIVLTLALWFVMGFWGIPIATAIAMYLGWMWFNNAVRHVIGVPPGRFLKTTLLWPAVSAAPGLVLCAGADWLGANVTGFLPNAGLLLACGGVFTAMYLCIIRRTPFFDAFDIAFLNESLYMRRLPGFAWWARRAGRV